MPHPSSLIHPPHHPPPRGAPSPPISCSCARHCLLPVLPLPSARIPLTLSLSISTYHSLPLPMNDTRRPFDQAFKLPSLKRLTICCDPAIACLLGIEHALQRLRERETSSLLLGLRGKRKGNDRWPPSAVCTQRRAAAERSLPAGSCCQNDGVRAGMGVDIEPSAARVDQGGEAAWAPRGGGAAAGQGRNAAQHLIRHLLHRSAHPPRPLIALQRPADTPTARAAT